MSKKKIVAKLRNGYGYEMEKEFENAEEYLDWKQSSHPELWNKRKGTYIELLKVTTKWLPLNWSDFK